MLAILTAIVFSLTAEVDPGLLEPRLALVRIDPGSKSAPLFVTTHGILASSAIATPAITSYKKFWNGAGNSPIRHLVVADLEGDGASEVVFVREKLKKGSRLDLSVVELPTALSQKKPKSIASFAKGALGFAVGEGRVVALTALAATPGGPDDLAIVRAYSDGHQSLEIRPLPHGPKQPITDVVASDPLIGYVGGVGSAALGAIGTSEVLGICSVRDGSGQDLLGIWRRTFPGTGESVDSLDIVAPPSSAGGAISAPIAGFSNLAAKDGAKLARVDAFEIDPSAPTGFLLERTLADGSRRVEIAPPPLVPDAPLVLVTQFALAATGVGSGKSIFSALSFVAQLPAPPPPPPPPPTQIDASGNYAMYFQYTNPWTCPAWEGCDTIEPGMPEGASYLMGPFTGFSATWIQLNFRLTGVDPTFLLDGTIGKPLVPDPYTNLMLQQLGAPAKLTITATNEPGIAPGSVIQFGIFEQNVRVTKHDSGKLSFASAVVGTVTPPVGDPYPLGYVVFVQQ